MRVPGLHLKEDGSSILNLGHLLCRQLRFFFFGERLVIVVR